MKKTIQFSKFFAPAACFSAALIISGFVALAVRGLNLGLDFKAGLVQEARIAAPAIRVSYEGKGAASLQVTQSGVLLVISGAAVENSSHNLAFSENPSLAELSAAMQKIDGVSVELIADGTSPSESLFADASGGASLGSDSAVLYLPLSQDKKVSADTVRTALEKEIPAVAVKQIGDEWQNEFQIRAPDDGKDPAASDNLKKQISTSLSAEFGEQNFVVLKTDFIGSQFSDSLIRQVLILLALTLVLIWIYVAIRFKWRFAFGAIVAIIHDVLIMSAFLCWSQMEIVSTSIAAILTIVGYSINATIVVLDRLRENEKNPNLESHDIVFLLNLSQTEMLKRSIITTFTTILAVFSLYIFTTGSMRDFALLLIVGMLSGVYSSILISSAVIAALNRKKEKTAATAA